ncbi:hypothetical protein GCM10022419_066120 [Nonomuraea rosea]|uniref:Peptide-methionine (S)-S-oxide reductase n=1 Tax=Nonomuraea rosea TaxID=638574 RepID=A0ABP6Y1D6_9ACTN
MRAEREPPDLLQEADRYHQQHLYKVPNGTRGTGGTAVACPVGLASGEAGAA